VHYAYNHPGFYQTMMDSRLVQDLSRILLTLHEGKAHTNAMIKKTGIYKNNVYEATRFLVKARLATRFKIKNVHRQKMFTQLNEFGQQLADLIENAEKFEKSFSQLTDTIRRVYNLPEDAEKKVIRSLLLNRGLNHQEIDKYEEHMVYAEGFERDSMSILIDGIVNKYALFLLEFSPNNYAKEFLKEIITRKLSNYLLIRIESIVKDGYFRNDKYEIDRPEQVATKNRINEMVEENCSLLFNFLDEQVNYPYKNQHIRNEVKSIVSCLFSIFHLPKERVKQKIKEEIEFIEGLPPPKVSPYLDEDEVKRSNETQREIYNYVAELNASA
jgi:hypothetical protein